MPPPPVPWFRGRTVVVTATGGLVAFKPLGNHRFTSPPGTLELYVPEQTLVLAVAEDAGIGLHGDFTRVDRPNDVVLAPVDPDDAERVERVLAERLGLPRRPRPYQLDELRRCEQVELVIVEGVYQPGHPEGPNFESLYLDAAELSPGTRYRVTGFYYPSRPADPTQPRVVGYSGPRLHALSVTAS